VLVFGRLASGEFGREGGAWPFSDSGTSGGVEALGITLDELPRLVIAGESIQVAGLNR